MKKYLKDTSNLISFSLALVPAILLYIFQPSSHIPYAVFVILLLVALTLVLRILFQDQEDHPWQYDVFSRTQSSRKRSGTRT